MRSGSIRNLPKCPQNTDSGEFEVEIIENRRRRFKGESEGMDHQIEREKKILVPCRTDCLHFLDGNCETIGIVLHRLRGTQEIERSKILRDGESPRGRKHVILRPFHSH
jgi:hypothetical protein